MNQEELVSYLIRTVQEVVVKIGDSDSPVVLYLPEDSMDPNVVVDGGMLEGTLMEVLEGRVRFVIPADAVHRIASLPVGPVLTAMVESVSSRDSLEDLVSRLHEDVGRVDVVEVDGDGFDHVMTFDEKVDPFVYCIDSSHGHVSYHRFTREDYQKFGYTKAW